LKSWWFVPAAVLLFAACDRETPLGVGQGLLPPGAVQTFEIVLDAERYLVRDTAFGDYTGPRDAPFLVLAHQFDGALNANALMRFIVPELITLPDTAGVSYIDTIPNWFAGNVRVVVDSLTLPDVDFQLALYHTAEVWDESATWSYRVDTLAVSHPWTVPGGRSGDFISRITVPAGTDTVLVPVDSLTIERWRQIEFGDRGALLVVETPGVRLRTSLPQLLLEGRPSQRPDTVVTATGVIDRATFIFEPEQPVTVGQPRVGGTPAWRTIYRLRERLDTISFACPGVPNCRVRLADAHINYAAMQLHPTAVPDGFRPEDDISLVAYLLFPTPQVPLQRSPLGDIAGFATAPATRFVAPVAPDAPPVEVQLTDLIRLASLSPEARGEQYLPTHFTVASGNQTFGFGVFESMPPLRLVISLARGLVLP
jgi:hypothetical protein